MKNTLRVIITLSIALYLQSCFFNPSNEVLEAFNNVNHGIEETIEESKKRSTGKWELIQKKLDTINDAKLSQRTKKCYAITKTACNSLYDFLEQLKISAVEYGSDQTFKSYRDNANRLTDPRSLYVGDSLIVYHENGEKLKTQINKTRVLIVDQLAILHEFEYDKATNEKYFTLYVQDPEDGKHQNWQQKTFSQVPRGAVIALLTKYQNDVRNAEGEFLRQTLSYLNRF